MANNTQIVVHLKITKSVYRKLKEEAQKQMRSVHSLAVYAITDFAKKLEKAKR